MKKIGTCDDENLKAKGKSFLEKSAFMDKSTQSLAKMYDMVTSLPDATWQDFKSDQTALIVVDLVNGFAREGSLMSSRVDALVPEIAQMTKKARSMGMAAVAFGDCHTSSSPEFKSYPPHCLSGTSEALLVDELQGIEGLQVIAKNSTNAFLEPAFQSWLSAHPWIKHFIVVGDCTDICIYQFATTLKCWFNRMNQDIRVTVPVRASDTYDFDLHDGDLLDVVFLYGMSCNGIELINRIG